MSIFGCQHTHVHTYVHVDTHIHTLANTVQVSEREKGGAEGVLKTDTTESDKKPTKWEETSKAGTGPVLHTCHPALGAPCATPGFVPVGPVHAQTGQAGALAWTAGS